MADRRILVTGATGKVGQAFLRRFAQEPRLADVMARAFCHNRALPTSDRLEVVHGSMANREDVQRAMEGVTHVLHLATVKETPEAIMDVAVKGLFWLLEECRSRPGFRQFLLIGGDAGIMEKDDFKYTLSFGEDVFGGPRWRDLVGPERAEAYAASQTVPIMLDPDGQPVLRNFVHVDDLVEAIVLAIDHPKARQQTFNICMNEPVNYRVVADYLTRTRGLPSVDISTSYRSTWLDNTKARFLLGWRPQYDTQRLLEAAWTYQRSPDDPRKIWYPG